ncbi:MAG: glycoside hydrolase domain-containing protein [Armatimonadota bacterium]
MTRRLLLFLAIAAVLPSWAQTTPTAHFSFDKDMNGARPQGVLVPELKGKPVLVPGKIGQGLQVGPKFGALSCPSAGVITPQAGTVEMWVKAVDWDSKDPKFHVFFDTRGRGVLYLYEYFNSDRLLMLCGPDVTGPLSNSQLDSNFKPGEWHHIAGTWSPQGVMAYFDGKPASALPIPGQLPITVGEFFLLGDEEWQFPRENSSVIDEVRIYDRALSPAHIAAHAAGNLDFVVPLSPNLATLDYDIDPDKGIADIWLDTGGADVADEQLIGQMTIKRPGAQQPEKLPAPPFKAGKQRVTVPISIKQPGTYELAATLAEQGKESQAFTLRSQLIVPTTEWLGNQIGLEDKVLPPWTPIRTQGTNLRCTDREYSFDKSLLPTQITAAGQPLLSAPITVKLADGKQSRSLTAQSVKLTAPATPTTARLAGRGTAKIGGKQVSFRTNMTFEYDGLLLVEMTCEDPSKLAAQGLTIDIPVKGEHALYLHRYITRWIPNSGSMPAGQGVLDKTAFVPYAWFGDNDRGLFWFCESDEMWPNGQAENAIEIVREGKQVVLRLNIMGKDQKLPDNWKLVFGLQATPVKPLDPDRRTWRMTGSFGGDKIRARQKMQIVWPHPKPKNNDSLSAFGWPEAKDPEAFAAYIKQQHDAGLMAIPYLCLTWITDQTPEWQFFKRDWEGKQCDGSIPEVGWPHQFALVSPVGKGYSDFIMWKTKAFMEKYHIDGTYHDQTHPYTSNNTRSGWGYVRDGKEHISYPILGYRALYRRNYAMVKSLPWPTWTQAHMSGKVVVPVLAYEDTYLDGEHFRGVVKDSYMDVASLDAFRAEYMGRQWGLNAVFLPEFGEKERGEIEPTRGLMALLMIHDIAVWPIWCNAQVVDDAQVALDEFGYERAEFIPYFDPQPPLTTALKDIEASAYKKADGSVLLVVANLSKEDRSGDVKINLPRLGLTGAKAISWPDKAPLDMQNGAVKLDIPRLGYRMIRLAK